MGSPLFGSAGRTSIHLALSRKQLFLGRVFAVGNAAETWGESPLPSEEVFGTAVTDL